MYNKLMLPYYNLYVHVRCKKVKKQGDTSNNQITKIQQVSICTPFTACNTVGAMMEVNISLVFPKTNLYNPNITRPAENLEKLRQPDPSYDLYLQKNCQGTISWTNLPLKKKQYQNTVRSNENFGREKRFHSQFSNQYCFVPHSLSMVLQCS